nr:unnamed protein product [Sorex araneus]
METESEQTSSSANGSSGSGASSRPQIAQMSLYERQAVQALQALQRQPNAAQYFHQFMLQQQLSNAQLHSLAAVQQATIAASRQASSPSTSSTQQQAATTQASINLATTSAAQLISRSQSVSSPTATTLTQSVLLGSPTSPPLSQSQAQMYLRPQLGNLLQVNRTLGRNVPLASQLILMPNGAVAAVQQEVPSAPSPGAHADADQVQNLAVRNQQASAPGPQMPGSAQKAIAPGAAPVSSLSQASSQALTVAQASPGASGQSLNLSQAGGGSGNSLPGPLGPGGGGQAPGGLGQLSSPGLGGGGSCPRKGTGVVQPLPAAQAVTVSQGSQTEAESAAAKKADADGAAQQNVGMNLTRTATPAPSQTLISSATYTQIQPHSLIQQQQQIHLQQKQVVIQQQIAIHHQQQFQHRQSELGETRTYVCRGGGGSCRATAHGDRPTPEAAFSVLGCSACQCVPLSRLPDSQGKPQTLAVKRKAETEEERDDGPALGSLLPAKVSPVAESPKILEERGGFGEKADPGASVNAKPPGGDLAAMAPAPSAPPPTLAMVSRQMGDSKPPQAIVKPQILTHIIEGFVIQEGAEPFPVGCSQILKESEKPLATSLPPGLKEKQPAGPLGGSSPSAEPDKKANLLKCEYCGKYAPAEQFRGSKRFCSMTCAKRYNVSCSHQFRLKRKKMKEFQEASYARVRRRGPRRSSSDIARAKIQGKRHRAQEDSSRGSDNSSYDEALSPTSLGPLSVRAGHGERELGNPATAPPTPELHGINPVFLSSNPSRWSVEEVYEFIASLQGCQEIAEEFRSQEIDGQALLLLKEEHLMSAMNIKLGPALKICAKINVLKET